MGKGAAVGTATLGSAPRHGAGSTPRARGEQTRRRIADSTLCLLMERDVPPTAQEIAARAGVSIRLIFHHFEDLDAVHSLASTLLPERFGPLAPRVPANLPVEERVERTVRRRATLYESIGYLGRNSAALAPSHPGVAVGIVVLRQFTVSLLEETFACELGAAGRRRKEVLGAIDTAVSWHAWDHMRTFCNLSVPASRRIMSRMLHAALDPTP